MRLVTAYRGGNWERPGKKAVLSTDPVSSNCPGFEFHKTFNTPVFAGDFSGAAER